jgi:transposase
VPRSHPVLTLKEGDEEQLRQWIAAYGTPQQVCLRSRIVLAAAAGQSDRAIVQDLGVNRNTVILWRARFQREGLDGLWEVAPGRGRKPIYGSDKIEAIVDATLRTKPKGMTHWSCRLMAESQKVSKSTINNIWPHQTPSDKDIQAVAGCEVLGEVDGCGGFIPESAAAGDRAVCR